MPTNNSSLLSTVILAAAVFAISGCAINSAKTQKVEATPAEPAGPTTKIVRQQVVLDATSLFEFDSAVLTSEGKADIDRIIGEAGTRPAGPITVVGHTDRIGPDDYNMGLSQRRATSVADYMIERGIPASSINASGKGESEPVVQCEDQAWKALVECLAPNRRVEVQYPTVVEEMMEVED